MPINPLTSALNPSRSVNLTTFTILVEGQALPASMGVMGIEVRRRVNSIPGAVIQIEDGDPAQQSFVNSEDPNLAPGKELEIKLGYSMQENTVFKGIITGQRIRIGRGGGSYLQVECKDPFFRTTLDRKSRYYRDLSDGDILSQIAGEYDGLSVNTEILGLPVTHAEVTQVQMCDWDFMMTRLEQAGLFATIDNGTMTVKALPAIAAVPAFSLSYGRDIFDLDLDMDARTQHTAANASSWDDGSLNVNSTNDTASSVPEPGNITGAQLAEVSQSATALVHGGDLEDQVLAAWAKAALQRSRMAKVRGVIKFQGNEAALPGAFVNLDGLGGRFNGMAFIGGVAHSVAAGDWHSTIEVGLSKEWHYERYQLTPPPAAGMGTAVSGLQVGVVTKLEGDPESRERIQVRLPLISTSEEGNWMRLASLDAGADRGFVFRPEVDDEVVVGFLQDDPNQAVVLGMLHSKSNPSPIAASDDNHDKGYTSREQLKLHFNDDTKYILLETPKGNKITLSEDDGGILIEDENQNKITLDTNGITIESSKDLILKANGDVKVEGTNVEQTANASFKASGSSGSELSSSATTVVKGSLVQIN